MSLQPAVCTNCGGNIKVDDIDLNGFGECEFCHTPYKIIDVITIDGLPTVKTLLHNAEFAIQDGNAEKAVKIYNEIISIKPNCHEAWWGLYLCNAYFDNYYGYKDKYGNSGYIVKAQIMENTISKYAYRAIEYAPSDQGADYKNKIEDAIHFIEQAKRGDFDSKTKSGKSGCYIATAVYGSYHCKEVIALRKFRDNCLLRKRWGKIAVNIYYIISPALSKKIRKNSAVENCIRKFLDRISNKWL